MRLGERRFDYMERVGGRHKSRPPSVGEKMRVADKNGYNMLCWAYWYWVFRDLFSRRVPDGPAPHYDDFRVNGRGIAYWNPGRPQKDREPTISVAELTRWRSKIILTMYYLLAGLRRLAQGRNMYVRPASDNGLELREVE